MPGETRRIPPGDFNLSRTRMKRPPPRGGLFAPAHTFFGQYADERG